MTPADARTWQQRYLDRFYVSIPGWVDGTTEFHDLCRQAVPPGGDILEIGAGPSNATSQYLASLGMLRGVDVDAAVMTNDVLHEARTFDGLQLPYGDHSFDACVSNWVVEHLAEPDRHLAEVRRVLRPGGAYIFRTSNCWHYVGAISRLTPHRFHILVANRLRRLPTGTHDPYPTHYRLNSFRAIRREARQHGFEVETLRMVEKEPSYGMASRMLFLLFLAYERLVNSTNLLAPFRASIFCVLRKPRRPAP